ncbi:MAG: peroxiredoxin [Leptospirillum sp.]|jgi:peroxiredoxin Q/BCP|nr:peroxiredoxin [Nitrospiraceae bacterium]
MEAIQLPPRTIKSFHTKRIRIIFAIFVAVTLFFTGAVLQDRQALAGDSVSTGMPAPDFVGKDQDGDIHKLSDYRNQWLVLYFFPKADTPGCTTEACTFRDGIMKLKKIGASVVGVSMDDRESQEHFAKKYHIPFPLLADHTGAIAKTYGAAGGFLGFDHRYTFLIDPQGRVAKRYLDVDPDRHAKQVLEDIKKLKSSKKNA